MNSVLGSSSHEVGQLKDPLKVTLQLRSKALRRQWQRTVAERSLGQERACSRTGSEVVEEAKFLELNSKSWPGPKRAKDCRTVWTGIHPGRRLQVPACAFFLHARSLGCSSIVEEDIKWSAKVRDPSSFPFRHPSSPLMPVWLPEWLLPFQVSRPLPQQEAREGT